MRVGVWGLVVVAWGCFEWDGAVGCADGARGEHRWVVVGVAAWL
jgi:hypothetical protein